MGVTQQQCADAGAVNLEDHTKDLGVDVPERVEGRLQVPGAQHRWVEFYQWKLQYCIHQRASGSEQVTPKKALLVSGQFHPPPLQPRYPSAGVVSGPGAWWGDLSAYLWEDGRVWVPLHPPATKAQFDPRACVQVFYSWCDLREWAGET